MKFLIFELYSAHKKRKQESEEKRNEQTKTRDLIPWNTISNLTTSERSSEDDHSGREVPA